MLLAAIGLWLTEFQSWIAPLAIIGLLVSSIKIRTSMKCMATNIFTEVVPDIQTISPKRPYSDNTADGAENYWPGFTGQVESWMSVPPLGSFLVE